MIRQFSSFVLASILFISSADVIAQKKNFTIAEATNGLATSLAIKNIKSPSWQPNTSKLWHADKKDGIDCWKVIDAAKNNQAECVPVGDAPIKVTGLPTIKWLDNDHAWFQQGKSVVVGKITDKGWVWTLAATLPDNAENVNIDKSLNIAFTVENNVYIQEQFSKKQINITNESDKNIVCGKAVHRDEFGIDRGLFFSPNGGSVAYYRMDQTMVKDYPIINWGNTPATNNYIKYPMSGGKSHEVTLRVYNYNLKKTVTIQTGTANPDHYLTAVTWSPDEQYIYIAILNRAQNHLWLNQYDANTGQKIKTLFEETDQKYVHPAHPLTFIPGSSKEFIWQSERDGFNHLYLYNTSGKLLKQITKGDWVVNELCGFKGATNEVIITTSKESALDKNIYAVGLNNGKLRRIDAAPGMHNAISSSDGAYVYDSYNNANEPRKCVIYNTGNGTQTEMLKAENTLANYARPEVRNVTIKAADGQTPLYGKLILPTNFDSTKKYPVIVYLYNGPNVQLLHNSYPESGNLWYEYMAQKGYIVYTMDGRGSWNRGLKFEQATFRKLGEVEMNDQLKGVEYLKSLKYVDSKRMGVHGWSFGGFMTTSLMLKHPNVFKCGVAGGPVMDWSMYEVMYTERYMDTPDENPKGYAETNLLDKVKNLKGKLMVIHGTDDDVVVWQHSINFVKKCVDDGVQLDYFMYPGHPHNVRGKDRVHLMQKISDYFDLYLMP